MECVPYMVVARINCWLGGVEWAGRGGTEILPTNVRHKTVTVFIILFFLCFGERHGLVDIRVETEISLYGTILNVINKYIFPQLFSILIFFF